MDVVYQKDAFSGLTDQHKTSMFQNAKLKDEVTLQGVGLNNLGLLLSILVGFNFLSIYLFIYLSIHQYSFRFEVDESDNTV